VKFVTAQTDARIFPGIWLNGKGVLDLAAAARRAGRSLDAGSMISIVAAGENLAPLADIHDAIVPFAELRMLAPIPRPRKNVFCVGRNYRDHVAEGYRAAGTETKYPVAPQFFTKPPTAVIGPDEIFFLDPNLTSKLDYEVELALIIGKPGRDIPAERAFEHIFGYTIGNDITARDLQRRHDQWFKGKGLDRSCPLGPWIIDAASIPDPTTLTVSLTVNGELRQKATVAELIFPIPTIIEQLSAGMTLESGDIILTGTPAGVGYAMDPPKLLKAGDIIVASIDAIGSLTTTIQGVG
jgi:2-keto-4-pentenoate hydratase/2-oxohepta-3-ene-1,7-dioic acid hydratase in catechol pathway